MVKFIGDKTYKKIDSEWMALSDCGYLWESLSDDEQKIIDLWIEDKDIHY